MEGSQLRSGAQFTEKKYLVGKSSLLCNLLSSINSNEVNEVAAQA